jgi:CheY-like chemotaxis protein
MDLDTDMQGQPRRGRVEPSEEQGSELLAVPKCTILVIDDDEAIRTALAEILELSGYQVEVAADGQEGLDKLKVGLEPKAIILDLMMPRMDGWTFLSWIRGDPKFQDVPVVVTSAVADQGPTSADVCLQKPFDVRRLDREMARLCSH